jgi:hypothetical protein
LYSASIDAMVILIVAVNEKITMYSATIVKTSVYSASTVIMIGMIIAMLVLWYKIEFLSVLLEPTVVTIYS